MLHSANSTLCAGVVGRTASRVFPSWIAGPINNIVIGKNRGHYETVDISLCELIGLLPEASGEKRVYVTCPEGEMTEAEHFYFLSSLGLGQCENSSNYLLGLMAMLVPSHIPLDWRNKSILSDKIGGKRLAAAFVVLRGMPFLGKDLYRALYFREDQYKGIYTPETLILAEEM